MITNHKIATYRNTVAFIDQPTNNVLLFHLGYVHNINIDNNLIDPTYVSYNACNNFLHSSQIQSNHLVILYNFKLLMYLFYRDFHRIERSIEIFVFQNHIHTGLE